MKKIRYFIEYVSIYIFFFILKFLPINFVSYLGGILFQFFGTFTKHHKIALSNYKKIFCNLSDSEINKNVIIIKI